MRIGPGLTTLTHLHRWSSRRNRSAELGELGLFLHERLELLGYTSSPSNAYAFASTGGDGVAFSLVDLGPGLSESSPVVMSVPMAMGDQLRPNWIVGQDIREFLALGLDTGYFSLEQIAYDAGAPERIAEARGRARPPLLAELAAEFRLSPWLRVGDRLEQLRVMYGSSLRSRSAKLDQPTGGGQDE